MNVQQEDIYLTKERSGRNLSVLGRLFLVSLFLGLLFMPATASWLSWWIRIPSIAGIFILGLLGINSVVQFIRNPVIELRVSRHGIEYGSQSIRWDEIARIYPRGGLTILGTHRYQLGYTLRKKLQATNALPVDGGISKKEFVEMITNLQRDVSPQFTHLNLKKP